MKRLLDRNKDGTHPFAYIASDQHQTADGLKERFAKVDPNWNKKPEPVKTASTRVHSIADRRGR